MKYIQYVWFHYRSGVKELVSETSETTENEGFIERFGDNAIWNSRKEFLADWEGTFGDVIYKEIL